MRTLQKASINIPLAATITALVAGAAAAQDSSSTNAPAMPSELVLRSSASVSVVQTRPQGALGKNIGLGYGVTGAYLFRLDRAGVVSIRADVGVVDYGNESKRTPLSETIGGRVKVNVRTTNYIVPMSIGPQLTRPTGVLRPYVNVGIGGQAFFTESHVDRTDNSSTLASTTNHSAFAAAWTAGGGIYMPVRAGTAKVLLDVGVQYLNGGRSEYLAPGSITDLPDGQIKISPLESNTHLLVLRVGARIGL